MKLTTEKNRYHFPFKCLGVLFNIHGVILLLYFFMRFLFKEDINFVAFYSNYIPVALIPSFAALPFALKKRDHFMIIWGGFAIAFMLFEFGPRFLPKAAREPIATFTIRVLSHNTGQDLPSYELRDKLIQDSQADIVILQEITSTYIEQHLVRLKETYPYQIYSPLQADGQKLVGMGILSRYPIKEHSSFKLDENSIVYQLRTVLDINGKSLTVYNIHTTFPWIRTKPDPLFSKFPVPIYDDAIRRKEIQNLIRLVQHEKFPIILVGDFNLNDQSDDYKKLISAELVDAYRNVGYGFGFTWPVNRTPSVNIWPAIPIVRVDYLFHSKGLNSNFSEILPRTGSDHQPFLTNLSFK